MEPSRASSCLVHIHPQLPTPAANTISMAPTWPLSVVSASSGPPHTTLSIIIPTVPAVLMHPPPQYPAQGPHTGAAPSQPSLLEPGHPSAPGSVASSLPHMCPGAKALPLWDCTALTVRLPRADWSLPARTPSLERDTLMTEGVRECILRQMGAGARTDGRAVRGSEGAGSSR